MVLPPRFAPQSLKSQRKEASCVSITFIMMLWAPPIFPSSGFQVTASSKMGSSRFAAWLTCTALGREETSPKSAALGRKQTNPSLRSPQGPSVPLHPDSELSLLSSLNQALGREGDQYTGFMPIRTIPAAGAGIPFP